MGKKGMVCKPLSWLLIFTMGISLLPLGLSGNTAQAAKWPVWREEMESGRSIPADGIPMDGFTTPY